MKQPIRGLCFEVCVGVKSQKTGLTDSDAEKFGKVAEKVLRWPVMADMFLGQKAPVFGAE